MIEIPPPMLAPAKLAKPFTSTDWLYELKFDGYRCLASIERDDGTDHTVDAAALVTRVQLRTKTGADCTAWFLEIVQALATLPGGPHVIDGEACVLRPDGTTDFNLLQERARRRRGYPGAPRVGLAAFDLLMHNGVDVMARPLTERKTLLEQLLANVDKSAVLFVKDLPADANLFWAMVLPKDKGGVGLEIEGVMAKRKASPYRPGRTSPDWLKIKRPGWQEGRTWKAGT